MNPTLHSAIRALLRAEANEAADAGDDDAVNHLEALLDANLQHITGAMFGAAKWLAWRWVVMGGPWKLIVDTKKHGESDRVIQCSKHFPGVR